MVNAVREFVDKFIDDYAYEKDIQMLAQTFEDFKTLAKEKNIQEISEKELTDIEYNMGYLYYIKLLYEKYKVLITPKYMSQSYDSPVVRIKLSAWAIANMIKKSGNIYESFDGIIEANEVAYSFLRYINSILSVSYKFYMPEM